jgi:hypothetical protein
MKSEANWINADKKNSQTFEKNEQSSIENNKSASLPAGVTNDWLSSLRDENGNNIIPQDKTFPDDPSGTDDLGYYLAITGEATNNFLGISVSSAGDVNGDGFRDVIVGAYGYSSNKGRAYIFLGGSSMDNVADVTMTGELSSNRFGISVSSAGDVNNDGYSDVIVGADQYGANDGRAYIFLGSAVMDNTADVIMTGENPGDFFGLSVSSAGDVNNDGYSDVIVGAYAYNSSRGRAYIYLGGVSMNNAYDVAMNGVVGATKFGVSVCSAGDVNGDGYSDVIVGAKDFNSSTGMAQIFFGGSPMNQFADLTMNGESTSNSFWDFSFNSRECKR